jgi:hypothetical protein
MMVLSGQDDSAGWALAWHLRGLISRGNGLAMSMTLLNENE